MPSSPVSFFSAGLLGATFSVTFLPPSPRTRTCRTIDGGLLLALPNAPEARHQQARAQLLRRRKQLKRRSPPPQARLLPLPGRPTLRQVSETSTHRILREPCLRRKPIRLSWCIRSGRKSRNCVEEGRPNATLAAVLGRVDQGTSQIWMRIAPPTSAVRSR